MPSNILMMSNTTNSLATWKTTGDGQTLQFHNSHQSNHDKEYAAR